MGQLKGQKARAIDENQLTLKAPGSFAQIDSAKWTKYA